MTQSLEINKKQYLSSAELAKKFDYTSDYISKLARDEKVLGTRVGRSWFIEPESLRTYIQQLEVEKRINKETLSRQRKLELVHKTPSRAPTETLESGQVFKPAFLAVGQAAIVFVCGILIGTVSYTAYTEGLQPDDVFATVDNGVVHLSTSVQNNFEFISDLGMTSRPSVATPLLSTTDGNQVLQDGTGPSLNTEGVYAEFPKSSNLELLAQPNYEEDNLSPSELQLPFSDEIEVNVTDDDAVHVRPVFRDSSGDFYELSVIPVKADE